VLATDITLFTDHDVVRPALLWCVTTRSPLSLRRAVCSWPPTSGESSATWVAGPARYLGAITEPTTAPWIRASRSAIYPSRSGSPTSSHASTASSVRTAIR